MTGEGGKPKWMRWPRPRGARNKATLLAERLMQDDAENIVSAVVIAARTRT